MLLTKFVEITWINRNKQYYIDLGYKFSNTGDSFLVDINHLQPYSIKKVDVCCDYCLEEGIENIYQVSYKNYKESKENSLVLKDCCSRCKGKKYKENYTKKQELGLLKEGDMGYFQFYENRLEKLSLLIDKYKILNTNTIEEWNKLYKVLNTHNDDIDQMVCDMGYDPYIVLGKGIRYLNRSINNRSINNRNKPKKEYNIKRIKNLVNDFISDNNRFPMAKEIKQLKIPYGFIDEIGGMYALRDLVGYMDRDGLVDDRGYYNKSFGEYVVAQFLIKNEIPYERDTLIFPDNEPKYQSDFTFYPINSNPIHVEVWGCNKDSGNKLFNYVERREIKDNLYLEHNIKLISVEYDMFYLTYSEMQEKLYSIFKNILNLKIRQTDFHYLIPPSKMSDDEIFKELMSYSSIPNTLPTTSIINQRGRGSLYKEIKKRHKTYDNFAKKYNVWTEHLKIIYRNSRDNINEVFLYILQKHGHLLTREEMVQSKDEFISIHASIINNKGFVKSKLLFYRHCLDNDIVLPKCEMDYIEDIALEKNMLYRLKKKENIGLAKSIYAEIFKKVS